MLPRDHPRRPRPPCRTRTATRGPARWRRSSSRTARRRRHRRRPGHADGLRQPLARLDLPRERGDQPRPTPSGWGGSRPRRAPRSSTSAPSRATPRPPGSPPTTRSPRLVPAVKGLAEEAIVSVETYEPDGRPRLPRRRRPDPQHDRPPARGRDARPRRRVRRRCGDVLRRDRQRARGLRRAARRRPDPGAPRPLRAAARARPLARRRTRSSSTPGWASTTATSSTR